MSTRTALLALAALGAVPDVARADEAALLQKIEQLETRIHDLEANQAPSVDSNGPADWTRMLRLGGSVNTGFYGGQSHSLFHPDSFQIWDARVFVDSHLGEDVQMGETTLVRDIGMTFEWDLVRLGELENRVGELYVDFQGLGEQDWANMQLGRFQIPVGEAYLRYSEGTQNNPFISQAVGGPWWWDEGIRSYGALFGKYLSYVASFSDGDTPFNSESSNANQFTLKLITEPFSWLRLSVSGLRSGRTGSEGSNASGALWLGETWARPLGASTTVATFQEGVAVPDGPSQIEQTWFAGTDAIFDFEDRARLWLAYGRYEMNAKDASSYDRTLHYWIAELLLRGAWIAPALRPFYAGVRANALGTYDDERGYVLDMRRNATLGYNMESLTAYSAVLGWELTRNVRLRAEYTHQRIGLVEGVTKAISDEAKHPDYFGVEVGAGF
jgi:hypothetical protein